MLQCQRSGFQDLETDPDIYKKVRMETSKYVGSYPPVGGHSLNQNQTASSTPTNLNGIQPQQNGAVYARAPRHGSAEGDQLLPERNPYRPYLPSKSNIS